MANNIPCPLIFSLMIFFCISVCSSSALNWPNDGVNVVVKVDEIAKVLWDADFKLMSKVLKGYLPDHVRKLSCRGDQEITIFAPQDEAIDEQTYVYYYRQLVTSKLDKHDFEYADFNMSVSNRPPVLYTSCNRQADRLVVTNVSKTSDGDLHVRINNTRITKWDIYNDGRIVVHGVENFFGEIERFLFHLFYMPDLTIKN